MQAPKDDGPDIAPALFERAKAGDRRAMDVVLAALRPALVARADAYLRKYPSSCESAEDAAQEALLKVFMHISEIESADKLLPWALKTALNDAKIIRRSDHRRGERVVVSSDISDITTEQGRPLSDYGDSLGEGNYRTPQSSVDYDGDTGHDE